MGQGLLIIEDSRSHSVRHTTLGRTPLYEWSDTQRPLPDNTQNSQETNNHAPGGIRTHNPSKRAAADPRLRPRGHWDRQNVLYNTNNKRRGKALSGNVLSPISTDQQYLATQFKGCILKNGFRHKKIVYNLMRSKCQIAYYKWSLNYFRNGEYGHNSF